MKRSMRFRPRRIIRRGGTTLSEVLISLLIMSVGVVSLATLFPISVLRSVQATQLTNATNLRYNVEAMTSAIPQIYTVGTPWQPGTAYLQNAIVTPSRISSLKYPPLVAICSNAGTTSTQEPNWLDPNSINADGGVKWTVVQLQNYIIDPQGEYIASFDDPTGMLRGPVAGPHFFGNNGSGPVTSTLALPGINFTSSAFGVNSQIDEYRAAGFSSLPDSWITQVESNSISYTAGNTSCAVSGLKSDLTVDNLILAPSMNGSATPIPAAYAPSRIVLFDITGKVSHVRPIMSISGSLPTQTIDWTEPPLSAVTLPTGPGGVMPMGPLPSNFTPVRARIETYDRRFTWLLSVRRGMSGASSMDVVVFFKRQYNSKEERIYPATFQTGAINLTASNSAIDQWSFFASDPGYDGQPGIAGVDDDLVNGTDDVGELGYAGSDDVPRNWVVIQYDASGEKPFYKKGGFVADATTLRWYRITDVVEGDAFNGYSPAVVMAKAGINVSSTYYTPDASYTATQAPYNVPGFSNPRAVFLRLEKPVEQSGIVPSGGPGGVPRGGAIFMKGVVDVYPIRAQMPWEN